MTTKAAEAVDLSLTLFGGTDTSVKATALPEGLSPQSNDVIFGPGFVASRPCLSKLFANPFTNAPRVVSMHSYLQANQQPLDLYLDVLGVIHQEDVTNTPGTYSTLGNVVPGSIMKAVTFDGVDYQVFSDGIHGIDIPRIYDGTNWDRLSQEGPGTAPTAADSTATAAIAAANGIVASSAPVNVTSASNIPTTLATITTATPHNLQTGFPFFVVGVGAPYDGLRIVSTVPDATTVTFALAGGGVLGAGGTIQDTAVKATTTTAHGLIGGDIVKITGNSQAIYNNPAPAGQSTWTVLSIPSPTTFTFSQNAIPLVGINGTVTIGGQISQGPHSAVVMFLTRSGYITKPSPPVTWVASGNKRVAMGALAIGPANVIARIVAFTGSLGSRYFWIPQNLTAGGQPALALATIINDNTSTTAVMDFNDNSLFAADAIDIPGNNLFALVTIAPCLGVDAYASRVFIWGEFNKVQRFLNMGFEGGTAAVGGVVPLGWSAGAGGALVTSPADFGLAWQITGNGGAGRGTLSQSAYQNYLDQFILDVSTPYTFYCWAKASAPGLAGNLVATLSSASTGFTSTATIAANTIPDVTGAFVHANFTLPTPAVIPSDLTLTIKADNLVLGATLAIDEMMLVFTEQPYRDTVMRGSYVNNPQSFDGVTGDIGPSSDPNPIRDTFQLLEQLTILTSERRHVTRDNDAEPGTWQVDQVETKVGAASVHSTTTGPNWAMWLSDNGKSLSVRITSSGESFKISREMKADFGAANMQAKHKAWITNVDDDARVYIGLPQGENQTPSVLAVLDYFESDTAQDIAGARPLKIGIGGKMLTTDLGRKWTIWRLPLDCGAVMPRPNGISQFVVGSGKGNGTPGPFGNVYTFDPAKLTDDDYGGMLPSYTTYFFVNHEMEQQLPVGTFRKLYSAVTTFIIGTGSLILTPHSNIIGNIPKQVFDPSKPWILTNTLNEDNEWTGLDVTARRMAMQISVTPLPGTTDVQFVLSHLGIRLQKHPVAPQSGVNRSYA
jgi:hypothetical protein